MSLSKSDYQKEYRKYILAGKTLKKMNLSFVMNKLSFNTFWCKYDFDCDDILNKKPQRHSCWELQLCLEGNSEYEIAGREYVIKKNSMMLIPPQTEYCIKNASKDMGKMVWGFSVKSDDMYYSPILQQFEEAIANHRVVKSNSEIDNICNIIVSNALNKSFDYSSVVKNQLYSLFINIVRLYIGNERIDNTETYDDFKTQSNVKIIRKYIKDNIANGVSCVDVATQFNLSERHLNRILKKANNMTIQELKHDVQLEIIRQYLVETDMSLKDIVAKSGFSDEYSMSKMFKRLEGLSPGKYRQATRE